MATATLTSKGQTTAPRKIRSYLGLHTGDKLEFLINEQGAVIVIPLTIDAKELKGFFPKPKKQVTLDDMKRAIVKRGSNL